MANELGELIRRRRQELDLTVEDVATGTGVSKLDAFAYEEGLRVPSGRTLHRLAAVLEVDVDTLGKLRPLRSKPNGRP